MKCATCPRPRGLKCIGEEEVRRVCELADPGHPDYRPAYRERARDVAPKDAPPALPPPPPAVIAAAARCPHRGPAEGSCGCHACGRDGRKVQPQDCWACIAKTLGLA